jgi:hypothetical protein
MKDKLIEVFAEFYGEEYRNKITEVIDNMLIILTGYGYDKKFMKDYIDKSKQEIKNILINRYNFADNLPMNKYLSSAKVLVHKMLEDYANSRDGENKHFNELTVAYNYYIYYSYIFKKSKKATYLYMASVPNNKSAEKFYKQFIYRREEEISGSYYPNFNVPLITVHGPKPNLVTIIHEVNHAMHKEIQAKFYDGRGNEAIINSFGITGLGSREDYIYEMINEYMAILLSGIYIDKYGDPVMQDQGPESVYYQVDTILGYTDEKPGPVLRLYGQASSLIKRRLIEGKGYMLKNIIGSNLYNEINRKINIIFNDLYELHKNDDRMISRDDIKDLNLLYINTLSKLGVKNIKQYSKEHKKQIKYINKLANEGKVKKLKREN